VLNTKKLFLLFLTLVVMTFTQLSYAENTTTI